MGQPTGAHVLGPLQPFVGGFLVELISVAKEDSGKTDYPVVVKSEGIAPSQYGTKGLVGDKLTEVEEKYDLTKGTEGFGEEGEEGDKEEEEEEGTEEEGGAEDEII